MSSGDQASLLSLQRWDRSFPHGRRFRWVLACSFCLHCVFLMLMVTVRIPLTTNSFPQSHQVSFVTLTDLVSKSISMAPWKPSVSPSQPVEESQSVKNRSAELPSTIDSVNQPREHLKKKMTNGTIELAPAATSQKQDVPKRQEVTDLLKGVMQSVVVPKPRSPRPPQPLPSPIREPTSPIIRSTHQPREALAREALKDVMLPPKAPDFSKLKPASSSRKPIQSKILDRQSKLDQQIVQLTVPEVSTLKGETPLLDTVQSSTLKMDSDVRMAGEAVDENPYWAHVRGDIDHEWVAAPIERHTGQPLHVVIAFRLERSGDVKNVVVVQSSGHRFYDRAAKRAVLAADPLPPFPEEMTHTHYDLQFQFTVRPMTP